MDPRVVVCHPGMQHAPWLVQQLDREGLLTEFWTGIAASDQGRLARWLPPGATNRLARFFAKRMVRGLQPNRLHLLPWYELKAVVQKRMGRNEQGCMHRRSADFQRALPERLFTRGGAVVGFDTASWIIAKRAQAAGMKYILDQTIGHPVSKERIYAEVRQRYPAWADSLETNRPEVYAAEVTEQRLAMRIVAASSFTRRTLIENGVPAERIIVNPYGVELEKFSPRTGGAENRPLRFVFVGQVSARKGIPLLLDVWQELAPSNAELWIVGHVPPRLRALVEGTRNVILKGAVPHSRVPELLRQCDVFLFPSYFEGFGLVLLEAMACGLPIVATDATGAPDLITEGVEGFVIKGGDGAALRERIQLFLSEPARAARMGARARQVAEKFTWSAYGARWAQMIRETVMPNAKNRAAQGLGAAGNPGAAGY